MAESALCVWWLTPQDIQDITSGGPIHVASVAAMPAYLAKEFFSATGRNGRGRLWVAPQFGDVSCVPSDLTDTPLLMHIDRCAGIVLKRADLDALLHLPGIVTDLQFRRLV